MLNTMTLKNKEVKSRPLSGKKIFLFAFSISILALTACGGGKTDNPNAGVPAGMVAADLSAQGLSALVNVPDSTVAPLEIIANAQGGADIKVGKNFQITVTEGAGDMEMKKNDITHDDVRKFIKYIGDAQDPNSIVWEWQIEGMEPEFHFYAIVKDGEKSFEVRDVEGEVFSEKAALQMLDAAKTVRVKAGMKAES